MKKQSCVILINIKCYINYIDCIYYIDYIDHIDRFIIYIKTDNVYKDIAEDVETRFDTSNYELG